MAPLIKLRLKFVNAFRDRHGKTRHYFRRRGQKKIPLPGLPGSAEFMNAYQQALGANRQPSAIGAMRTRLGSVDDVVARYLGSTAYGNLAPSTRRDRLRLLDQFREDYGAQNFATLTQANVERILAAKDGAPQSKKNFLKALRAVAVMAVASHLRADDPTLGIKIKTRQSDGFGHGRKRILHGLKPIGRLVAESGWPSAFCFTLASAGAMSFAWGDNMFKMAS